MNNNNNYNNNNNNNNNNNKIYLMIYCYDLFRICLDHHRPIIKTFLLFLSYVRVLIRPYRWVIVELSQIVHAIWFLRWQYNYR